MIIWFTGISGAGKTTIAKKLHTLLSKKIILIDGDALRAINNNDLGYTKKDRDIGKLAIERTKSIERIINKGGENAARCIELASGAEHTEEELKATLKSQINPECPALANPNYVPYK